MIHVLVSLATRSPRPPHVRMAPVYHVPTRHVVRLVLTRLWGCVHDLVPAIDRGGTTPRSLPLPQVLEGRLRLAPPTCTRRPPVSTLALSWQNSLRSMMLLWRVAGVCARVLCVLCEVGIAIAPLVC